MNIELQHTVVEFKPAESKLAWHAPRIVRIDIKQTMLWAGSASDGSSFTT